MIEASSGVASLVCIMSPVYEQAGCAFHLPFRFPIPERYHGRNMIRRSSSKLKKTRDELPIDVGLFAPGERICVAVSGGADSTALLRALLSRRAELGIVLTVLHVEHGLRGAAARDAAFVAALAKEWELPCEIVAVDTPRRVAERKESVEEAARNLRYQVFRAVLADGKADKIATAHTLDDQAETVLMKLLRGAWTEGLSGIHPVFRMDAKTNAGTVIRPLLAVPRTQVEAYLRALGQPWCEDETNQSADFTRNRVRHELMPILRTYNPQIEQILAHVAANARAEEHHWQQELARLLPQLLLPGKPVRGGGRSVATQPGFASVALEIARLKSLDAGLCRRILRVAAEQCGATLDFDATERLLAMVLGGHTATTSKRLELPGGVLAQRSARELRLERSSGANSAEQAAIHSNTQRMYELDIPGTVQAPAFGACFTATLEPSTAATLTFPKAHVRAWQPGDRVRLRYSGGPKKVKEVLERLGIRGDARADWPVVEWQGNVVWMRGVDVENDSITDKAILGVQTAKPHLHLRIHEAPLEFIESDSSR